MYRYMYIYMYTHIYTHIFMYMYINIHIFIYIFMYICMHICMHICSYVYISHEATDMRESWHTFECVMAHIWMSQETDLCQGSFTTTAQNPKHKWWYRCGNVLRRCRGCRCFLSCYRALYTLGSCKCMRLGLFWVNVNRALSHNQKLTKDRGGVEGREMPSCLLHTLNHAPHTHGALLPKKT